MVFTTLAHHIDVEFLREAHRRTRKDGAAGVDRQTAGEYAAHLEANLESLLDRFKSGQYFAPPVRRVDIPKGDGKRTRPIGIPTFEDKVLQRAVTMVLDAVYEQDFLHCSYGFRPNRSAHDALQALRDGLTSIKGGWVIEVDIQGFFDSLDHGHLRSFLDRRVRDGVIRRAIGKWLNAGVMTESGLTRPDGGTPQGGVISPLLANVYLHEVLDRWFESEVKPRLEGSAFLVRYADDFVLVFAVEHDARRVWEVLPKRFGKYGLTLHPDKTRLLDFRSPVRRPDDDPPDRTASPRGFDLLGFTHHWGRARSGWWVLKRKTASDRFTRALRAIWRWCREHRHAPIATQHQQLAAKVRGHYGYYGLRGNARALARFGWHVARAWHRWLARRSGRAFTWAVFCRLLRRFPLPPPRVLRAANA